MMTIRQAKSGDAKEIAKIHIDSWRAAYKGIVPDSRLDKFNYIQHSDRFRQSLETNSEETYVAEIDIQIIGFLTIGPCRDNDLDQNDTGESWIYAKQFQKEEVTGNLRMKRYPGRN